jgi:hypothetical protein
MTEKSSPPAPSRLTKAERVSLLLGVAAVLVAVVAAVPSFLALRAKAAAVLFETASSQMILPESADRDTVRRLLRANRLPDASTRIALTNRGDNAASEVVVSVRVPGIITASRITPTPSDRPAWVSIRVDSIADPSRVRYTLQNLGTGPTLTIEISYLAEASGDPTWDVFADGKPARATTSLSALPPNVNAISFRGPLRILLGGLVISLLTLFGLKAVENAAFREALGMVVATIPGGQILVPRLNRDWHRFHTATVLSLVAHPHIRILSSTNGRLNSVLPAEFWDIRLVINEKLVVIDCHTISQRWPGLVGSEDEQADFCARLAGMTDSERATCVIALDRSPDSLGSNTKAQELLERLSSTKPSLAFHVIGGDPESITRQVLALAGGAG